MSANTPVLVTQIPRFHSSKSYTGCMRTLVPTGLQELGSISFDNTTPVIVYHFAMAAIPATAGIEGPAGDIDAITPGIIPGFD